MALVVSIIFLCLSAFIALGNICGCIAAYRRARRNDPRGYSNVAVVSLVLSTIAWAFGRETIGLWAFIPALLDPGTWSLVALPIYLIVERSRRKGRS